MFGAMVGLHGFGAEAFEFEPLCPEGPSIIMV